MKAKTTTIIILLAAAGLGYYLWTKRKKAAAKLGATAGAAAGTAAVTAAAGAASQIINQGAAGLGTPAPAPGTGSGVSSPGKYSFSEAELTTLLNRGKTGTNVKALQIYLNKSGANLATDGNFGQLTETALRNREGTASTTLKTLKITAVDTSTNNVFGSQFGWSQEGIWNGVVFV